MCWLTKNGNDSIIGMYQNDKMTLLLWNGGSTILFGKSVWCAPIMLDNIEMFGTYKVHVVMSTCIIDMMYACIIMHNMIINDEVESVSDWGDNESNSTSGVARYITRFMVHRPNTVITCINGLQCVRGTKSHPTPTRPDWINLDS